MIQRLSLRNVQEQKRPPNQGNQARFPVLKYRTGRRTHDGSTASAIALPMRALAASLYGSAVSLSVIHRLRNSKPSGSPSAEKFRSGFSRVRAMGHPFG